VLEVAVEVLVDLYHFALLLPPVAEVVAEVVGRQAVLAALETPEVQQHPQHLIALL